jgi:hypothetical protein
MEPLDARLAALFTPMDLKRLDHYRAAVRADFYTDELTVPRVGTHALMGASRRFRSCI